VTPPRSRIVRYAVAVRLVVGAALAVPILAAGGCAIAGLVAEAAGPTLEAEHELADVPTLIMVEDRGLRLEDPALPTFLANAIAADLRDHGALGRAEILEQSELGRLSGEFGREFNSLGIDEIGQRVGAQQVLYVEVQRVQLERAPGLWEPRVSAGVKVIDAVGRERVYPPVESIEGVAVRPRGRPVVATLPAHAPDGPDRAYRLSVLEALAQRLATRVGQLFYDHKAPRPGDRLPG